MPIQFNVGGRLILSEILAIFLLPVLYALKGRLFRGIQQRRVIGLGLLWLVGLVATDLIRGTKFEDYSRGWALVSFTLIDFALIFLLAENKVSRIKLLFVGYAIGTGLETLLTPGVDGMLWKMGGDDAVLLGALALLSLWTPSGIQARRFGIALEAANAVLGVLFNARNVAGRAFVDAIMLASSLFRPSSGFKLAQSRQTMIILALLALPTMYVGLSGYAYLAQSGVMGDSARATYAAQSNSSFGPFGVLFGGRPEIFVASQAIADSPIIGHGSWARSMDYYLRFRQLAALGFDVRESGVTDPSALVASRGMEPEIPAHSILFGSWVWAGVFGAVFWCYALYLIVRCFGAALIRMDTVAPLLVHASTLMLWDILFSPYGNDRRFEAAIFLTAAIIYARSAPKPSKATTKRLGLPALRQAA